MEAYVQWCERAASQLMVSLLLDCESGYSHTIIAAMLEVNSIPHTDIAGLAGRGKIYFVS